MVGAYLELTALLPPQSVGILFFLAAFAVAVSGFTFLLVSVVGPPVVAVDACGPFRVVTVAVLVHTSSKIPN